MARPVNSDFVSADMANLGIIISLVVKKHIYRIAVPQKYRVLFENTPRALKLFSWNSGYSTEEVIICIIDKIL